MLTTVDPDRGVKIGKNGKKSKKSNRSKKSSKSGSLDTTNAPQSIDSPISTFLTPFNFIIDALTPVVEDDEENAKKFLLQQEDSQFVTLVHLSEELIDVFEAFVHNPIIGDLFAQRVGELLILIGE